MALEKINKVIILHGYAGNESNHWQGWLAKECENRGLEVHYPAFPDNLNPSLEKWLEVLTEKNITIDASTAVVCHSLGCVFALQYFKNPNIKNVGQLILVAPATLSKLHEIGLLSLENFYEDVEIKKIKNKILRAEVFYSDNDPYVDAEQAIAFGLSIHATNHLISGGAHLSVAAGFTEFPEILSIVLGSVDN
jgi:predicted alpha/beta hydrolase family esterase